MLHCRNKGSARLHHKSQLCLIWFLEAQWRTGSAQIMSKQTEQGRRLKTVMMWEHVDVEQYFFFFATLKFGTKLYPLQQICIVQAKICNIFPLLEIIFVDPLS